jgi:shikimate kinase
MPGAGKSTVGVLLAKLLGMRFVDTDIYIQHYECKPLGQILEEKGLDEFLRLEEKYILSVETEGSVIAPGGSAVYSPAAMEHLKNSGKIVYLKLPLEQIKQRVTNLHSRAVVMPKGETLDSLYRNRQLLYEKYADITIDCTNATQQEIAEMIVNRFS